MHLIVYFKINQEKRIIFCFIFFQVTMETLMLLRQTIQMAKKHENLGFFGGKFSDYISTISTYRSMKLQSYNFLHLFLCKKSQKKNWNLSNSQVDFTKKLRRKKTNNNDAPNFISSLLLLLKNALDQNIRKK